MVQVCSAGFSHELPWVVKRSLDDPPEPSMQLVSTHRHPHGKQWSYSSFLAWQADTPKCCVVANVVHVATGNLDHPYYPHFGRPCRLDSGMHKLHHPGQTKDAMTYATLQGDKPFDRKVLFGPVDPLDTTVQYDFERVVSEEVCRELNAAWNKPRTAAGQVGELTLYKCVKDPVAPHTVAIHKLGVNEAMRHQLIRGFTLQVSGLPP